MVKNILPLLKSWLLLLFVTAYVMKSFFAVPFLSEGMAVMAVLIFCAAVVDLKSLNRKLILSLLFVSGLLILSTPGSFDWTGAIIENSGIVTLLITVPMLGAILHYDAYEAVIVSATSRFVTTGYRLYLTALGLTVLLTSIMSLAALPFIHQLLQPLAEKYRSDVLDKALTRGFAFNLFWAPNLIGVAVVLRYVQISWQELVGVGLWFSALVIVIAVLVGKYEIKNFQATRACQESVADYSAEQAVNPRGKILALITHVVVILLALTLLNTFLKKNIYVSVALVAVVVPFLIAMPLGKIRIYYEQLTHYRRDVLPAMSSEFMIFMTIGFFGYSLANSPLITWLQSHAAIFQGLNPDLLCLCIIMTIMGLAIGGIHPIVSVSSLAIALVNIDIGLSALQLAISFITGYIMYLTLSPFSSAVMVLAGISGQNVQDVGIKLNWRYAAALTFAVVSIIHVWRVNS